MEYKKYKLGEFIDTISDTTPINKDKVILVNTSDVENGYVLNHNYVENKNLKGQFKKRFRRGDILYSEIRPKNKRFAYIDFDAEDYIASTKLMVLRNKGNIDNEFLFQLLKSDKIISYLQMLAESRSGTFPQITFNELSNVDVYIPEVRIQKKISGFLQKIDNKIELNNKINDNLLELINNLYKESFSNIEEYKQADEIANITIGKTPPRSNRECFTYNEDDIKWLSISDLGKCGMYAWNTSEKLTEDAVNKYNVKVIPENTIVLSFKLTIGRIAITANKMATNEAIAHFNLIDRDMIYYLYSYLKNFDYSKLGNTSSIATAVNSKIIKAMPISVPNKTMILEFNNKVKPLFEKIKLNEAQNETLEQLRDTLLPKLMNGEIDLDKIEI